MAINFKIFIVKATEVVSIVAVLAITVSFAPSKEEDGQSALVFASYGVYYCFSFRDDVAVDLQIKPRLSFSAHIKRKDLSLCRKSKKIAHLCA